MTVFPYVKTAVAHNLAIVFLVMGASMIDPSYLYEFWRVALMPYSTHTLLHNFATGNYICLILFLHKLPTYFLKQFSFEGMIFLALIIILMAMEPTGYIGTAECACIWVLLSIRLSVISLYLSSKVKHDQ